MTSQTKTYLICPVCNRKLRSITAQHFRKHGFQTAQEFKEHFGMEHLSCQELRERHSRMMTENSPNRGKKHKSESIAKMSRNRRGKGIGTCGTYERTPEIRQKISEGVTQAYLDGRLKGYPNFGGGEWVYSPKAGRVWVRSGWEKRVLAALDRHLGVRSVEVEPFSIPYELYGQTHQYLPDFQVTFTCGIRELWEVKPREFQDTPRNEAKWLALQNHAGEHGLNCRLVFLHDIEAMERQTGLLPWRGPGRPWRPEDGPDYRKTDE